MAKYVKKARVLFFPNLRKLGLKQMGWKVEATLHMQSLVPRDPNLLKKLGIQPKSKVLVLAGYYGNWARSLAHFCDVKYTDMSRSIVDYMKKHKGKVKAVTTRPAQALVRRPQIYDWSFLFEPFPLESMRLVLLRSLLNNKGCKVVGMAALTKSAYALDIETIDKLYGAKSSSEILKVKAIRNIGESARNHSVNILTIHTNGEARKKAMLDLRLLHKLNVAAKKRIKLSTDALCRELGVSREALEESRERLSMIALGISKAAETQDKYLQ